MNEQMTLRQSPEERELSEKRSELAHLEELVAQRELDLATLRGELSAFEVRYLHTVGALYAKFDEIRVRIAEAKLRLNPNDGDVQKEAQKARAQAQQSAKATGLARQPRNQKFKPSKKLKKLYRDVAKLVHPDLAVDDEDRASRQQIMAEANQAYAAGEEAKLRVILYEWVSSPDSVDGEGTAVQLVRTIRKIAQLKARLDVLKAETSKLTRSDLFHLKSKVDASERKGQDLLRAMANDIEERMEIAQHHLETLLAREPIRDESWKGKREYRARELE